MYIHQYLMASHRDDLIGAIVTCRALASQLGLLQGSAVGVIEGAYRHLVEGSDGPHRCSLVGDGAEAILRLRALRASGDFDNCWSFHLAKEHERTHQSRYADKVIPNLLPPRRPKLRLI